METVGWNGVPEVWERKKKKSRHHFIFKKEDSGNHRAGKVIVQIILEAMSKMLTGSSQYGFTEGK